MQNKISTPAQSPPTTTTDPADVKTEPDTATRGKATQHHVCHFNKCKIVNLNIETHRSPAEISETVGHRNARRKTKPRHLNSFFLKTPTD